jgi:hypothetical protein
MPKRNRNRKKRQKQNDIVKEPAFNPDAWFNDPRPLCPWCSMPSDNIAWRPDMLLVEIYDQCEAKMLSCLDCYDARRQEV